MGCVKGENTTVHLFAPAWTIPNRIFNDRLEFKGWENRALGSCWTVQARRTRPTSSAFSSNATTAASHESPKSKASSAAAPSPFATLSGPAAFFASCRFKKHSLLIIHRE